MDCEQKLYYITAIGLTELEGEKVLFFRELLSIYIGDCQIIDFSKIESIANVDDNDSLGFEMQRVYGGDMENLSFNVMLALRGLTPEKP